MNKRNSILLAAAVSGLAGLGYGVPAAADQTYYMANECRATSGRVVRHESGEIANPSEVNSATVRCPIHRSYAFLNIGHWVVAASDVNVSDDITCFIKRRAYYDDMLFSTESESVSTPVPGYTGVGLVEELRVDDTWYVGVFPAALSLICDIPVANGPNDEDRSKIFMYTIGEG